MKKDFLSKFLLHVSAGMVSAFVLSSPSSAMEDAFKEPSEGPYSAFIKKAGFKHPGVLTDTSAGEMISSTLFDAGYGLEKGRVGQYEHMMMPKAPILHPYHTGANVSACALNIKYPRYYPSFIPPIVDALLKRYSIPLQNTEAFLISQTLPWPLQQTDADNSLLLRPHGWLFAAPKSQETPYCVERAVKVGVFSPTGQSLLRGQPQNDLLPNKSVSSHNFVDAHGNGNRDIVSSPNNLDLSPLKLTESQFIYSVTIEGQRAAVVQHLILNDSDQAVLDKLLKNEYNNNPLFLLSAFCHLEKKHLSVSGQLVVEELKKVLKTEDLDKIPVEKKKMVIKITKPHLP